jgi:acyl dehydratase
MNNRIYEKSITAFMDRPDAPNPDNEIHSTNGGKAYGYKAALVGGVDVYGWGTPLVLDVFGNQWLDDGWIDISFRHPVYPGDQLTVSMVPDDNNIYNFFMNNQQGQHCIQGHAGCGEAPWLNELHCTRFCSGQESVKLLPDLTLENAPVGEDLKPRAVLMSVADSNKFVQVKQREQNTVYFGDNPRLHPAWLAAQMTHLLHHSYRYGPAIHTSSQIQNLAPAYAGQTLIVTGHCCETYLRKGHHYIVNDGSIWSEQGTELNRIRHTAIFKVARKFT